MKNVDKWMAPNDGVWCLNDGCLDARINVYRCDENLLTKGNRQKPGPKNKWPKKSLAGDFFVISHLKEWPFLLQYVLYEHVEIR